MSKEIYLAGKINSGEGTISAFAMELEGRGHLVLEKWWEKDLLPKPYLDNMSTSKPAAEHMIDAAYRCEILVMFAEDTILGAAVELGAALASAQNNLDKQIIIVNPFDARQSVFYAHPRVTVVSSVDYIRKLDWY